MLRVGRLRISRTAPISSSSGSTTAIAPKNSRIASASRAPTGPAPENQTRHPGEDGEAEQEQPGAVAAVLRVELAGGGGLPADGPDHPADRVRETHPERADRAAHDDRRAPGPDGGGASWRGARVRRAADGSWPRARAAPWSDAGSPETYGRP